MTRFDDALVRALAVADDWSVANASDVVVIRDLLGRIAIGLHGSPDQSEVSSLAERLRDRCHPFVGTDAVVMLDEMFAPELITKSPDRKPAPFTLSPSGRVSVIERTAVGSEWLSPRDTTESRRVTLYGFKGGVGRSTAAFALAHHLASSGLCVLVVDLDLESPGVSTMLAPDLDELPPDGILDHLVEHAVGNAEGLDLVTRSNALGQLRENGEVWFSAVSGRPRENATYLDKLSRVYIDLPGNRTSGKPSMSFGDRLEAAIAACEAQVESRSRRPDVVLLDSRSGIHDVAAVAITQLSNLSLLFATDNPQTWQGYRELFSRWQKRLTPAERASVRSRLQMVASMVPQSVDNGYLRTFADNSQSCFADTLYDDENSNSEGAFNFAPADENAPHYPLGIYHSIDLIGVVPGVDARWLQAGSVNYAYSDFLRRATDLILETPDDGA